MTADRSARVALPRRLTIAVLFGLVAASLALAAPAGAAVSKCQAQDVTLGTKESPNLQGLINAAGSGDAIQVKGVCVGNYTISKSLTVFGKPTKEVPNPTLDGNAAGYVVKISGPATEVAVTGLSVRNGKASVGAGIQIDDQATVSLTDVIVHNNQAIPTAAQPDASFGGGIGILLGTLSLNGSSAVRNNTASNGAGIVSLASAVTLNDSATISNNTATRDSAGVSNQGDSRAVLTLNDSSSVKDNSAGTLAGGIGNAQAATRVVLNDSSSVKNNSAGQQGGGIVNVGKLELHGDSTVHGNTAPPGTVGGIFNLCSSGEVTGAVIGVGGNVFDNTPTDMNSCP